MFFSAELLQKRDSGYGLLWLAATLGSQSTFKKLPKRSVLMANISQLCNLIADPSEPLALRLSSNLMVGVVRVYKVKQEILMTDVTACSNSLKKLILETLPAPETHLQMAQPNAKASALTLAVDPKNAFYFDFDNMVADWDKFLEDEEETRDPKRKRARAKGKENAPPSIEHPRTGAHTLQEYHEDFFSQSLDLSLSRSGENMFSSQADDGFGDLLFDATDGIDISGALGDEFVRELGEGWGVPTQPDNVNDTFELPASPPRAEPMDMDMPMDMDFLGGNILDGLATPVRQPSPTASVFNARSSQERTVTALNEENVNPSPLRLSPVPSQRAVSPAALFTQQLLSQEEEPPADVTSLNDGADQPGAVQGAVKKQKKPRLLLDSRIELTDDELKAARTQYMQEQRVQRQRLNKRRFEKEGDKLGEDMVWKIPYSIKAPELVSFWQDMFKDKVRTKAEHWAKDGIDHDGPASKRRKVQELGEGVPANAEEGQAPFDGFDVPLDQPYYGGMDMELGMNMEPDIGPFGTPQPAPHRHSSEDLEQARRAPSQPASQRSLQIRDQLASQSNFLPWDDAAAISSSLNGGVFSPAGHVDGITLDLGLRGNSIGRQEGSLGRSQLGTPMRASLSPITGARTPRLSGYDFAFEVPKQQTQTQEDSQANVYLATLEKNSTNFLEYVKMQCQTLEVSPGSAVQLTFDDIVPKATSTRHIAAAGFYHCLVLATKDLLRLDQTEPYGRLHLGIV